MAAQCAALARGELPHINAYPSNMMAEIRKTIGTIGHKMINLWNFDELKVTCPSLGEGLQYFVDFLGWPLCR